MTDQLFETAQVTGGENDGVRVQPRSVHEHDLVAVERIDGRDHLDRPVPDRVDHLHINQRRDPVEPVDAAERTLVGDRQAELAEIPEVRFSRRAVDRIGDRAGRTKQRPRNDVVRPPEG